MDEQNIANNGESGNNKEQPVIGHVSGWTVLRDKLQLSNKNSTAFQRFKDTLKLKYKTTEEELCKIGGDFGKGNQSIATRAKSINDAFIGMSMDSDSHCTCNNTCSTSQQENGKGNSEDNGESGEGVAPCQCICSKCYHGRPENAPKEDTKAPEHFTHIKHASLYMC